VSDDQKSKTVYSSLLGKAVPYEEFAHQNMQPFGAPRQQQLGTVSDALPVFERFTGQSSIEYRPKREQHGLFAMSRDMGNMHGMPTPNDIEKMRMENLLQRQNNVLSRCASGRASEAASRTNHPMDKLEQEIEIRKHCDAKVNRPALIDGQPARPVQRRGRRVGAQTGAKVTYGKDDVNANVNKQATPTTQHIGPDHVAPRHTRRLRRERDRDRFGHYAPARQQPLCRARYGVDREVKVLGDAVLVRVKAPGAAPYSDAFELGARFGGAKHALAQAKRLPRTIGLVEAMELGATAGERTSVAVGQVGCEQYEYLIHRDTRDTIHSFFISLRLD
jgi:hypothetical protein